MSLYERPGVGCEEVGPGAGRVGISLLAAGVLLVSALLTGCGGGEGSGAAPFEIVKGSTLTGVKDRGRLVVGMEMEFPPFESRTPEGEPVGFDVDLAKALAAELGVELELRDIEFSGMIQSLDTGKVDLAISGITATLERARRIAFSQPYFLTGLCLLVRKDSPIQSHEDLNDAGVTLALKEGTTGHTVSLTRFPDAKKRYFTEEGACVLEVVQGKADAFVYDRHSVIRHQRRHADSTRALTAPFTYEPYAIAFRQGEPDLGRFLDQFLETLERDGRMEALRDKHFGTLAE